MMRRRLVSAVALAGALLVVDSARAPGVRAQENVPEVARPLLDQAERHRDAGRIPDAVALYQQVLKLAPDLTSVYVSLGALHSQQGRPDEALAVFRAGLARAPGHTLLLFNAAAIELQQDRVSEALTLLDQGIARDPADASFHVLRGTALRRLDRSDEALDAFRTALRLDPQNARAHFNLGNVYHELGQVPQALDAYRQAIRHDRTLMAAYYNLGAVLFEMEDYEGALGAYEVGLAPIDQDLAAGRPVDSSHAQAYLNLGAIFLRKQEPGRALRAYQTAAGLNPSLATARYNIGYIHYQEDRLDEAYEAYLQALALDRALPLAYLHLGLIDFRRGRTDAAAKWLADGLQKFEAAERRTALLTLVEIALAAGDADAARERYRQVLAEDADDVAALVGLGSLLRRDGQLGEARELLARAGSLSPVSAAVLLERAALARAEGDVAAERTLYTQLLEQAGTRPDIWQVHVNLVTLLVRQGATREAARTAQAALERFAPRPADNSVASAASMPSDVRTALRSLHGALLARDGRLGDARREFQTALGADPGYPPARMGLAVTQALQGNLEEARDTLGDITSDGGVGIFESLAAANLGQILWLMGRLEEAGVHLRAAVAVFPEHASLHAALGEIALAERKYDEATEALTRVAGLCAVGMREMQAASQAVQPTGRQHQIFQTVVGGPAAGGEPLCNRARRALGVALLGAASQRIFDESAAQPGARQEENLIERALAQPLDASNRAYALFLRGTSHLIAGQPGPARDELRRALAGELPREFAAAAHNNLGVALYQTGAVAPAQQEFETARAMRPPLADATVNLAIALHAQGDGRRALALYEEYLTLGGPRSDDVRVWIDGLRRIYR